MPDLPPLESIRAFEAAAGHESFVRAGQGLGVTAATTSHQVQALETHIGAQVVKASVTRQHWTAFSDHGAETAAEKTQLRTGSRTVLVAEGPRTAAGSGGSRRVGSTERRALVNLWPHGVADHGPATCGPVAGIQLGGYRGRDDPSSRAGLPAARPTQ